jgi:hypothetical protein
MSSRIEEQLRNAIELQKRYGRRLFCSDTYQWNFAGNHLDNTDWVDNNIASLLAEIEFSGESLPESAFYLAAKQLFDCRAVFTCKEEQKSMGDAQDLWPRAPYIHPERLNRGKFEELYPVEHLATLFRFCEVLMDDCKNLFDQKDATLIFDTLDFQMKSTRRMLECAGYQFLNSSNSKQEASANRIVSLIEHKIWE